MIKENNSSKGVLHLLFRLLEKEKIPYIVLRNYENLPEEPLAGSDVDLLIKKEDEEKYLSVLKESLHQVGAFRILTFRRPHCLSCFIYQKKPFPLGTWLDAFFIISTKGFVWADGNSLFKKRIRHKKGFFIPPPGVEAALIFLKEIFSSSSIKKRYRLKIPDLVKFDKESFVEILKPYFRERDIEEMFQICLNKNWDLALRKRKSWWRDLVWRSFYKNPLNQIILCLKFLLVHLRIQLLPKGMIIAVIGPDGSGKTTLCQNLPERMKNFSFKKTYYYHGHFGFFPELRQIYNSLLGIKEIAKDENNLSKFRASGKFVSLLHLIYYGLEHFLSWPWVFWVKMQGHALIFDRYLYDFVATGTHRQLPSWLFLSIAKITPRPDLLFILKARPEEIQKRKPELTLDEIKKQLAAFEGSWVSRLTQGVIINTERPSEIVLEEVEKEILRFLEKYGDKRT